jgi:hypothetical protein
VSYARPAGAHAADYAGARAFEELVGGWLGTYKVPNLDAVDRLDYWVPGVYLDVKEKNQRLTARWWLLPGVEEVDLFVIDELSVRRAAAHFPHAYFLIRDRPGGDRIFLARIDEVFCAERARLNRIGKTNVAKGKWVVDLSNFRQLSDPAAQLLPTVLHDQTSMPWKQSACLSMKGIPTV